MESPIYTPPPNTTSSEKESQVLQLLGSIAGDQKIIIEQNETLLRNEKNKKIWGIVKWVLVIGLFFISMWALPAMIQSMVGNLGTGNIDQLLGL